MSDEVLTFAAIAFELGIPLVAAVAFWRAPALRPKLAVVLGVLTPAVVFYAWVSISYAMDPDDPGNRFAFFAGWMMTFFPFAIFLGAGFALSFIPKPINLLGRYILGLVLAALVETLFFL